MKLSANFFGSPIAEHDRQMLSQAFTATAETEAILESSAQYVVVGRRGSGKTALFGHLADRWANDKHTKLILLTPDEAALATIRNYCELLSTDYKRIRQISRLIWHYAIMHEIARELIGHYKFGNCGKSASIKEAAERWKQHKGLTLQARLLSLLRDATKTFTSDPKEGFIKLQQDLDIEVLAFAIKEELASINLTIVIIVDRLDEGWDDTAASLGFIAGLLASIANVIELHERIRVVVFLRDNIFRALSIKDTEGARLFAACHIRLQWDRELLFKLVCNRIRVHVDDKTEPDLKLWNLVAGRGIEHRAGFDECLGHTLFRPRDIILLLHHAAYQASRHGRDKMIDDDIRWSATHISSDRRQELLNEYGELYPALRVLLGAFGGKRGIIPVVEALEIVSSPDTIGASPRELQDLELLPKPADRLQLLYSVGFIGVRDGQNYTFCHDGNSQRWSFDDSNLLIMINPPFWNALNIAQDDDISWDAAAQLINDEYEVRVANSPHYRNKRINELLDEINKMPLGNSDSMAFEEWCLKAAKTLFSGQITNIALHPNGAAHNRRDIIGTVVGDKGFWSRIQKDYQVRQLVIDAKNYFPTTRDDFRQLNEYLANFYGSFGILISRSEKADPDSSEIGWIKTFWHEQKKVVMVLPVATVKRMLNKYRNPLKHDYADEQLGKLLDWYQRSYLSM